MDFPEPETGDLALPKPDPPARRAPWSRGDTLRATGLLIITAGMILVHYLTPAAPQYAIIHDIHRQILYIPIILAAFWFGWRGGLLLAAGISATYFPHIHHGQGGLCFHANLNWMLEILMYAAVGGITGYLIDRLRKAYAQLDDKSNQLRRTMQHLTEKTREVFEAEEQLRQADRLKTLGQLTSGLAHEIRNPLASIRGAAEILGDAQTATAERQEFSRVLVEETERLDGVLKNFLDYARTQKNGRDAAELEPAIERLLKLLDKKLKSARVTITRDLPPGTPPLAISETLLSQVLMNVLLNSIQAMHAGGILEIQARLLRDRGMLSIAVSDTGPGVPPDLAERIFDPFFTTKVSGSGLGLSIVRKIVTGHGGEVRVDTQYAGGMRLIILLPVFEGL